MLGRLASRHATRLDGLLRRSQRAHRALVGVYSEVQAVAVACRHGAALQDLADRLCVELLFLSLFQDFGLVARLGLRPLAAGFDLSDDPDEGFLVDVHATTLKASGIAG